MSINLDYLKQFANKKVIIMELLNPTFHNGKYSRKRVGILTGEVHPIFGIGFREFTPKNSSYIEINERTSLIYDYIPYLNQANTAWKINLKDDYSTILNHKNLGEDVEVLKNRKKLLGIIQRFDRENLIFENIILAHLKQARERPKIKTGFIDNRGFLISNRILFN